MTCVSVRITRSVGSEKSTSMPSASRLKSSMMLSSLKLLPSSNWSCMKSIDHTIDGLWYPIAAGASRAYRRLPPTMRRFNSSSL